MPALRPVRTWPSSSCAIFVSATLRESLTSCVTSTCQSLPSRKFCWPCPSSSKAPRTSPASATKCVRTRRLELWYCTTQLFSVLSSTASSSPSSSVTLSYLQEHQAQIKDVRQWERRSSLQVVSGVITTDSSLCLVLRRKRYFEGYHQCNSISFYHSSIYFF